jgi:hypothetical protein
METKVIAVGPVTPTNLETLNSRLGKHLSIGDFAVVELMHLRTSSGYYDVSRILQKELSNGSDEIKFETPISEHELYQLEETLEHAGNPGDGRIYQLLQKENNWKFFLTEN